MLQSVFCKRRSEKETVEETGSERISPISLRGGGQFFSMKSEANRRCNTFYELQKAAALRRA